jgi:hypothetical protein
MADTFTVTGQKHENVRQPDGTVMPSVVISYATKSDPPINGTVSVPQALLADKAKYVDTVSAAITQAVAAHDAVANL